MLSTQNNTQFFKFIDSHCHLDDRSYNPDLEAVLQRATEAGVAQIMNAGINLGSSKRCVALTREYPQLSAAVGFHPHDAAACSDPALEELMALTSEPGVKAWGEIGLDFNRMFSPREDQEKWFVRQLACADELKLPVILHERDSDGRLLELLNRHHNHTGWGVVHCFSGTTAELREYLAMGYCIGITGIITTSGRNRRLLEQVNLIPADRLLIETDAPYLTPLPEKKKHRRNEPAFVASVLKALAAARGEPAASLAQIVFDNTVRLFHLR